MSFVERYCELKVGVFGISTTPDYPISKTAAGGHAVVLGSARHACRERELVRRVSEGQVLLVVQRLAESKEDLEGCGGNSEANKEV